MSEWRKKRKVVLSCTKTTKPGCLSRGKVPQLTRTEAEVYDLLKKGLTQKQIRAIKLNKLGKCSEQAVSKIVCSLKRKGFWDGLSNEPVSYEPTLKNNNQIRMHGIILRITILEKSKKCATAGEKRKTIFYEGATIVLSKSTIEVYCKKEFYGGNVQEATQLALGYLNHFLIGLQNHLNVFFLKARYHNIDLVSAHYAETNNELAKDYVMTRQKLSVKATEDGKTWLLIDDSLGLKELEAVHPNTSGEDMTYIPRFFNDLRDNKPPVLSEIMSLLKQSIEINKETAAGLNAMTSFLRLQFPKQQGSLLSKEDDLTEKKTKVDYVG